MSSIRTQEKNFEKAETIHKLMAGKYKMDSAILASELLVLCIKEKMSTVSMNWIVDASGYPDVETKIGKDYFDYIQGQTETIRRKPAPDGAFAIAEKFAVETGECLYVGDTNTDMQTGNAAHMHPVGVLWGFRDRKELEENHSEYVIEKPQELIEILEKINGGDNK